MKKWSEIRQGIINKLFMDEQEVNSENENYASKFAFYANECLNQIANRVKPRIAVFNPVVYFNQIVGSNFTLQQPAISYIDGSEKIIEPDYKTVYIDVATDVHYVYIGNGLRIVNVAPEDYIEVRGTDFKYLPLRVDYDNTWVVPDTSTIYNDGEKKLIYKDSTLIENNNVYLTTDVIPMPEDFLSFADMVNYLDGFADPEIIYVTDKHITLSTVGSYKIFYNALWQPITEDYMNDQEQPDLPIDQSILNCIPSYVASQILAEDDVQRSTILRNEYELMLSGLDTNIMYQENHFKSTGGWY